MLVDEYQDTNRLQASILLALKPNGNGLTVVGDDAQSIYSFRAATVRNILDFPGHFSRPPKSATLERNYRSTQPILAAANAVIELAEERFSKTLWSDRASAERPQLVSVRDETDQARYVADKILDHREAGIVLKAQAVLFRAAHHSAVARDRAHPPQHPVREIRRPQVPGGRAHQGRSVVPALGGKPARPGRGLSCRCSSCPASVRRPPDGCSNAPAATSNALAGASATSAAAGGAAEHWAVLLRSRRLVARQEPQAGPPSSTSSAAGMRRTSSACYDDAVMRQADLVAARRRSHRPIRRRERFLTELTLDPPDATSDEAGVPLLDEDYLILSTIHSAKGQEWRSVFILNAVDGCIPSDLATGSTAEIEEERRLLYVAMTRAQGSPAPDPAAALLAHAQRGSGDRHMYAARTRFIPAAILDRFENCAWPSRPPDRRRRQASGASRVDIGARLRRMWS